MFPENNLNTNNYLFLLNKNFVSNEKYLKNNNFLLTIFINYLILKIFYRSFVLKMEISMRFHQLRDWITNQINIKNHFKKSVYGTSLLL